MASEASDAVLLMMDWVRGCVTTCGPSICVIFGAGAYLIYKLYTIHPQTGGGQYNPQMQVVGKIANVGDVTMGSNTGAKFNFGNEGNNADKQIQGVSGGSIHM